ncbi:hypothetical protein LLH00_10640 [bacterium]|nr:hypothetical protein [bacterium]
MEELISYLPAEVISAKGPIRIRFLNMEAEPRQFGVKISKRPLTFDPGIPGYLAWEDGNTLAYYPEEKLERGRQYTGTLDVTKLLPRIEVGAPVTFTFRPADFELEKIDAKLITVGDTSSRKMRLTGELTFSAAVKPEELRDKIVFTVDDDRVDLRLDPGGDERTLLVRSEDIERTDEYRVARLTVDGSIAGGKEYVQNYSIYPDQEFEVSSITTSEEDDPCGIDIQFTEPLDKSRDLSAFVAVDPEPEGGMTVTVLDQTLRVRASFERGVDYRFELRPGVRSAAGACTRKTDVRNFQFRHLDPGLRFDQTGIFLPFSGKRSVSFRAMNLDSLVLDVQQVFASNLGQFLQVNQLDDSDPDRWYYGDLQRVAKSVHTQVIRPGTKRDIWERFELDLGQLLDSRRKAAFVVQVRGWSPSREWPYNSSKLLISTDLGLTAKWSEKKLYVFVSSISGGGPVSGARVQLFSKQLQVLAGATTDSDGKVEFDLEDHDALYVAAEKGEDRSCLKTFQDSWRISGFETGGVEVDPAGVNAFIYTDRGVYRPGDTVHLSCVARNRDKPFPADHPVTLKLFNPRGQLIDTRVNSQGHNGLYCFDLAGNSTDMTGAWMAELLVGDRSFSHEIKVETVIPNRLKVELSLPDTVELKEFKVAVDSRWLFGAPAAELKCEAEMWLRPVERRFKRYPEFVFTNPQLQFEQSRVDLWTGALDAGGKASFAARPTQEQTVPSALEGFVKVRVFEKGGNFTEEVKPLFVEAYDTYLGIQPLESRWGWMRAGQVQKVPLLVLDRSGAPVAGHQIKVRLYRNSRYWWWDFEWGRSDRFRFRDDDFTRCVSEATLSSGPEPVEFSFNPDYSGMYFLEARDEVSGHSTGWMFYASSWGSNARSVPGRADVLNVLCDRKVYAPGETARLRVEAPGPGHALLTLEKGGEILWSRWQKVETGWLEFDIPVTRQLLPNAYVSVSLLQAQSQRNNDLPLRLYGIVPLMVEDPKTRLPLKLALPDKLEPNRDFTVELSLEGGRDGWATVAVVDEGLLDLTDFTTPDPWKHFYAKQRLDVETSDLFDNVLDAVRGNIGQRYTIGGDFDSARRKRAAPEQGQRFRPVALFSGPVHIEAGRSVKVPLRMPGYIGAVRVMAVSLWDGAYGSQEKSVPVRTPLIVLPTVPRVIGPGEEFDLPVTVFALEGVPLSAQVRLETDSLLTRTGEPTRSLSFDKTGSQLVTFRLKAAEAVGQTRIKVSAVSGSNRSEETVNLTVRPSSPLVSRAREELLESGKPLTLDIPALGLPGTNSTRLVVNTLPELNLAYRLDQLIHYPYGCLEQTTSGAFPQLYLKDLAVLDKRQAEAVDDNINVALAKLRRFQLGDGYLAYWPGSNYREDYSWTHAWAGHFMLAAREKGYYVPPGLLDSWIACTSRMVKKWPEQDWEYKVMTYDLFLLALAERPQMSSMNWLRENHLDGLEEADRWLLAAAYHLAGRPDMARRLATVPSDNPRAYRETGRTFGSDFRDRALILYLADLMGDDLNAARLFQTVGARFSKANDYFSTQETAFALLAFGRYLHKHGGELSGGQAQVSLSLDGGAAKPLEFSGGRCAVELTGREGGKLKLNSSAGKPLYVVLQSDGVPLDPQIKTEEKGLRLKVDWMDEDGAALDPGALAQGRSFWALYTVERTSSEELSSLALSAVFPSGWEIDNLRLNEENRPDWMKKFNLGGEDYVDIRDDRVNWFFNLNDDSDQKRQFVIRLTATYSGRYTLPAASAEAMYDPRLFARVAGRSVTVSGGQ